MLMLIHTAEARSPGEPGDGPDGERERRWEPLDRRLFVPAAASLSCLIVSAVTAPLLTLLLTVAAAGFCAQFVRVALREHSPAGDAPHRARDPE